MSVFYGFLALCLFAGASANPRVRVYDDCPEIETASNFNRKKYIGRWYEYGNYDEISASNYQCKFLDWKVTTKSEFSALGTRVVQKNKKNRPSKETTRYVAHASDSSKPERLTMWMRDNVKFRKWNYWILRIDYTSYAVGYRCDDGVKRAWIWTRKRKPPQSVIDEALKIGEQYGFKRSQFTKIDQSGCDTMNLH